MLNPKYIEELPDAMVELYSNVEQEILADMARRIATYDYWIPAADWQYQKMIEAGNFHSYVLNALSSITGKTTRELEQLMQEAGAAALKFDTQVYRQHNLKPPPLAADKALQDVLNAGYKATKQTMKNLTRTTAKTAQGQFEAALDRAWLKIQSGAFSTDEAVRSAVKCVAESGLQSIRYPSGRVDSIEIAVRRAVVTGVNQTAAQLQWELADEMGCDLVEVTAHAGARPEHAVWQGQVFSRSGKSKGHSKLSTATGYGTAAGLCGVNCRHSFNPYFEGSPRTYSEELLQEYEAKNYTYNGQNLTEYEASQEQRRIERNIRRWKRENAAMEAAGLDPTDSAARLASWQVRQRDFLKQTGLKRQSAREQVAGFRENDASKVAWVAQETVDEYGNRIVETIGRSVGAKAKNYRILNPITHDVIHLSEGTHITQPKNHVMAGKGRNRKIDEIQNLLDRYGGDELEWTKEKGFGYVDDDYGEPRRVEIHWYQEPSVGKVKMKIKIQPNGGIYIDED